ncbi:DNA polymerase III subunit epsilon [Chitinispirillum alkaliphilum]|nr:DNA polymerase III subunit epsilon [Chitinispirillum alkaliphilum]
MDYRFAAIDFETADYGRDSACALSVIIVDGTQIEEKHSYLIRPPRKQFTFTNIHGITWEDVENKSSFPDLWPTIQTHFENISFIAAHNAPFDRSVLKKCCLVHSIQVPQIPFLCSMKLVRGALNLYPTNLPHVCSRFGITLKHHDAESDALACAKIIISCVQQGIILKPFIG